MKTRICLFLMMFLLTSSLYAQTNVSGTINSNTTWTAANSPYRIIGSVTVNTGFTLTIESGVTVEFNDNLGMTVKGTLNATEAIFTSSSGSPTPGKWDVIHVQGVATLNNCQVQYGQNLIVNTGATLNTTNGTAITSMASYGVYLYNSANFMASNTSIVGTGGHGVYTSGVCNISLTDVSISNVSNNAIYLTQGSVADFENINLASTNEPIQIAGSAIINASGTNSLSGNRILVSFTNSGSNTKLPKFNIPYYFSSNTNILSGHTLTIESGVILKFASVSLTVNGTLNAQADNEEKIYFTSIKDDNIGGDTNGDASATGPVVNDWYGVIINGANSSGSLMKRCYLRFAGSSGAINIVGSDATVDSTEIYNSYYGIHLTNGSSPSLTYNTIGSSTVTPIAMSFDSDPVLVDNVLSFSDNQFDAIGLIGSTIVRDAVVKKRDFTNIPNITYMLINNVTIPVGRTLTVEPGVVIKSESGYNFYVEGTLNMDGTTEEPIVLTSARDDNEGNPADTNKNGTITTPSAGQVGSIVFAPGSGGSVTHTRLKYATGYYYVYGQYTTTGAIVLINTNATISNNEIRNTNYGVLCYKASNPTISDNIFANIQHTPVAISSSANPVFSGNTIQNVGLTALGIIGEDVTVSGTIAKRDFAGITNITYVLLSSITIKSGTNIEVEPGVTIKVNPSQSIFVEGGFKVAGTTEEPITFTSIYDDNSGNPFDTNGDGNATTPSYSNWDAIHYKSTSDDAYSTLDHARIKFASQSIYLTNANTPINFVRLSNNGYGLTTDGNSAPNVDNLIVENSTNDPLRMSLTSDPTFTNITLTANGSTGIRIIEGNLSSNALLKKRDIAGVQNIAYRIGQLTIASGSTLTVEPGVVMKFSGYDHIAINGALIAEGSSEQKIIFTSINDDSAGGDTNNNGNATVPGKSDWTGIFFTSSNGNSLQFCEFRYSAPYYGGIQNEAVVKFINSGGTMQNCIIQQANTNGISISGSSNPEIIDCEFYNLSHAPIYMSMFSEPTFSGNTMANIGINAISIFAETYNQTDTIPQRNFGGYNSITYHFPSKSTISAGTTITILEGTVFKSSGGGFFTVNGKLNVKGTEQNPVVFTIYQDDAYGNPADQEGNGNVKPTYYVSTPITFNDISDDASLIEHAVFRYSSYPINLNSASPTIDNNLFELGNTSGIYCLGTSAPIITNNTFKDLLGNTPFATSLITYPALLSNNTIEGITVKGIRIIDETLTQDVVLPQRDFAGIANIPYVFGTYTIGTSAVLTIEPGVICKFNDFGTIHVQKGLIAEGTLEEPIIFTHLSDDFYGGDTDGSQVYTYNSWSGIDIPNDALDASTRFDYVIIKNKEYNSYAYSAFNLTSSSPTITNSIIDRWYYGVSLTGASNPSINNNTFGLMNASSGYAIRNTDLTFTINAENNWWNDPTGPTHTDNSGGKGGKVTNGVDYTPFQTLVPNPEMGDVSQNGKIQAYDAALVLQAVVSAISLTPTQERVADVSGNGSVMAMDASYILQYSVGLIGGFDALASTSRIQLGETNNLELVSSNLDDSNLITIPVKVNLNKPMYALQASLKYDSEVLDLVSVEKASDLEDLQLNFFSQNGLLNIAMAGSYGSAHRGEYLYLSFRLNTNAGRGLSNTHVLLTQAIINEEDVLAASVAETSIDLGDRVLQVQSNLDANTQVYPNPLSGPLNLHYNVEGSSESVKIEIFNSVGQLQTILLNEKQSAGNKQLTWGEASSLSHGIYLLKITVGGQSVSRKLIVE